MVNYGAGATGALSGAASGAAVGSVVPGIGTAIGAGVGAVVGGAAGLFGDKKKKKISAFDKRQKKLNKLQHQAVLGEGPLADLYNYNPEKANSVFDQTIANPAYRNFKEKLAPQVTGQFRQNNLMNSSYAGDALSKLARDVQETLNGQRSQFLYGEEKEAKTAKRNAVDTLQGHSTQVYDKAAPGGFDIDTVLKSISPETIKAAKDAFGKTPPAAGTSSPAPATG